MHHMHAGPPTAVHKDDECAISLEISNSLPGQAVMVLEVHLIL